MLNTRKYSGYKVTLQTALGVEECRQRLDREFSDARGRWQHGASDKKLRGIARQGDFLIHPPLDNSQMKMTRAERIYKRRAFSIEFRPFGSSTLILGKYGYVMGDQAALMDTYRMVFAMSGGFICFLFGLIGLVVVIAERFWPAVPLFGGLLLIGPLIMVLTSRAASKTDDGDFIRERDYVVRYLERVLEAKEVKSAD
jgi:hypothetical protein